ncbi:MAG: MATE family efflux transporter, partial [Eubacteriales bacterium]|nr:MATE family efflux transporter [Eubacteriales bacterium]
MDSKNEFLATEPVGKLLFRLSLPSITAQLINMLYNLVDRIYIGRIPEVGSLALTGVGVCLPVILIVSAFAALISMGAAPRASIRMGEGKRDDAERILGSCVSLQLILSAVLTAVLLIWNRPLLLAFGASENTIGYASGYLRVYALGTVCVQLTLGMNAFITAQGFAKTGMLTVLIGAVTNIILDPLLIFGCHMGVQGAALATILSQALSAAWAICFLCGKKTTLRIRPKYMTPRWNILAPCLALGLAPFIMQASESVLFVCFNSSLQRYGGDIAVGAMTILTSVMQIAMLPLQGLAQGAQPISSYNFGAKNAARVKKTFFLLLCCSLAYSTLMWAAVMLFPRVFAML